MRLIDADALIVFVEKWLSKECDEDGKTIPNIWIDSLKKCIDVQPTTYDVEKVVERLEKNGQKMSEAKTKRPYGKYLPGCHNYYKAISVKKAVEIVKGGGVNDN